METLGHSLISRTMDTYSHVLPGMQAEAAARLDDVLNENGRQNAEAPSAESQEWVDSGEIVVSRLGIEPRTRR